MTKTPHGGVLVGRADMSDFLEACGPGGPFRLVVEGPGLPGDGPPVLDQPFALIGREPNRHVTLAHPDVSRRHAYLQRISGRVFCVDLASRTGVHWPSGPAVMGWVSPERGVRVGPFRVRPEGGNEGHPGEDLGPPPTSRSFDAAGLTGGALEFPDAELNRAAWRISRALVLCGSSRLCKVQLPSPGAFNVHCALVRTPQGVWVVDLLGGADTRVNGRPVGAARLDDGDEIGVGRYRLVFRRAAAAEAPAAAPSLALTVDPVRHGPARPGTGDDLVAALLNELGQTRAQMGDQFRGSLMMVLQMFGRMHQEQAALIREELAQLRALIEPSRPAPAGGTPALRLVREADAPEPSPGVPGSDPVDDPAPDVFPAPTPPAPGETAEEIHARLVARLATLQDDQAHRWQGLLGAVFGKKG